MTRDGTCLFDLLTWIFFYLLYLSTLPYSVPIFIIVWENVIIFVVYTAFIQYLCEYFFINLKQNGQDTCSKPLFHIQINNLTKNI